MRLKVLDQITLSAIRPEMLRPREIVDVDDTQGAELLKKLPGFFSAVDATGEAIAAPAAAPRREPRPAATRQKKPSANKPEGKQE